MADQYTLYFAPGACSLSPHIALRESGLPFALAKVDLKAKQLAGGGDWLSINPKGYVPALRLPDGEILTENAVVVQYIADKTPESRLAPPHGTMARYRLNETVHFIATELHKAVAPLYNSLANEEYKAQLRERTAGRFTLLAKQLDDRAFLHGDAFTIADGYAFYTLRAWKMSLKQDLRPWPVLVDYYQRLATRPTVAAALEAENLQP